MISNIIETKFVIGDATNPQGLGNHIIVHVCNDLGAWGKGFVLALSKKWKSPEEAYRNWYKRGDGFELGAVQFVQVSNQIWIANLIGQHKIGKGTNGIPPVRYHAIRQGLRKVKNQAIAINAKVHMPRIGCGLAGGKWEDIQPIIDEELSSYGIENTVYDLK